MWFVASWRPCGGAPKTQVHPTGKLLGQPTTRSTKSRVRESFLYIGIFGSQPISEVLFRMLEICISCTFSFFIIPRGVSSAINTWSNGISCCCQLAALQGMALAVQRIRNLYAKGPHPGTLKLEMSCFELFLIGC